MPPISINLKPYTPTFKQKREMHLYLKILLHTNGSLPHFTQLISFWELSVSDKVKTLQLEINETRFNPESTFAKLDIFYKKLIESIKEKNPTAFKKDQLLYPWFSTLGKTFNEFRINELNRWKSYNYNCQKYQNDVMINQRSLNEESV